MSRPFEAGDRVRERIIIGKSVICLGKVGTVVKVKTHRKMAWIQFDGQLNTRPTCCWLVALMTLHPLVDLALCAEDDPPSPRSTKS